MADQKRAHDAPTIEELVADARKSYEYQLTVSTGGSYGEAPHEVFVAAFNNAINELVLELGHARNELASMRAERDELRRRVPDSYTITPCVVCRGQRTVVVPGAMFQAAPQPCTTCNGQGVVVTFHEPTS